MNKNKHVAFCFLLLFVFLSYGFRQSDTNPLVGVWNLKTIKATVNTNNSDATNLIKNGIEENPYISVYFDADGTGCYGTFMEGVDELIETPFTYEILPKNKIVFYMEIIPGDEMNEEEVVSIQSTFEIKEDKLTLITDETKAYDVEALDEIGVEDADQIKVSKVLVKSVYKR